MICLYVFCWVMTCIRLQSDTTNSPVTEVAQHLTNRIVLPWTGVGEFMTLRLVKQRIPIASVTLSMWLYSSLVSTVSAFVLSNKKRSYTLCLAVSCLLISPLDSERVWYLNWRRFASIARETIPLGSPKVLIIWFPGLYRWSDRKGTKSCTTIRRDRSECAIEWIISPHG